MSVKKHAVSDSPVFRQGKSRTAALDYVVQNGGVIYDAVATQVWSGEANVHVSRGGFCPNMSDATTKLSQKPSLQVCYLDNQPVALKAAWAAGV